MRYFVTFVMKVIEIILIALQITTTISRRKQTKKHEHDELTSSEESIENLLYYKDCKHQAKQPSTEPPPLPVPLKTMRQPECPCPRMCCSMCCECGGNSMGGGHSMFGRGAPNDMIMGGINGMSSMSGMGGMGGMGGMDGMDGMLEPMGMPPSPPRQPPRPVQPSILHAKKKKIQLPKNIDMSMLPPIGARRGSGFTREHIKNLISQDEDIKKILKDLVKVTMSKVDMVDGAPVPQPIPKRARFQRWTKDREEADDDD